MKNSQHVTSAFLLTDIEEAVNRGLADQELGAWAPLSPLFCSTTHLVLRKLVFFRIFAFFPELLEARVFTIP